MDKIKAEDLIAKKAETFPMPSAEALVELQKILAHNDIVGNYHSPNWVSRLAVLDLLNSWGYPCTKEKLEKVCRALGRRGYHNA